MTERLKTDTYTLVEGRHGRFLANPQDIYLGRSLIAYGEFSEQEWVLLNQLVPVGGVVIEAGANMGALTVPIAKKAGRGGLVYAFEPQIGVFQQLCANLALNDLVNVQAFNAGCGESARWMGIQRLDPASEQNYGGLRLGQLEGKTNTRVRIERLDEALDPGRLDLIKADVEGMECEVLRGASGLINAYRPNLYLEANEADAPDLITMVQELNYDMWWHLPPMFSPDNFFGNPDNQFGRITSKNLLCVPAEQQKTIRGGRAVLGPEDHPNRWSA